ncbi:MAG TPA: Imm27 family immunity protein [Steroidobacteraceae bacterium]|jgi:hypothetical protein
MSDFDKHLQANETTLSGTFLLLDGKVVSDMTCERIDWIVQHQLQKVANSTSGWATLYRDPNDGRHWERTCSQSETHGGGPPRLNTIIVGEAEKKYGPL